MRDCHDSHCCIEHLCKYGDEDCPVANGIRKQDGFCEMCGLETEEYCGNPKRSIKEQEAHLENLWEIKQGKKPNRNKPYYLALYFVNERWELISKHPTTVREHACEAANKYEEQGYITHIQKLEMYVDENDPRAYTRHE